MRARPLFQRCQWISDLPLQGKIRYKPETRYHRQSRRGRSTEILKSWFGVDRELDLLNYSLFSTLPRKQPSHMEAIFSPRSTPISAKRSHRLPGGQYQSTNISRPKTAAVILGRTECDRVHQLESEPTRRHNFESHLPLKRSKPPPWQKNLEAPLVPFQTGPGYILTRSKTKCHVTIKDEFFDPILDDVDRKKPHADPERDNLIAQLQQQISDLTLYLEEERLNHKQTKQKAEEYLRDRVDQMASQHQDHIRELEDRHKEEMLKQQRQMEEEHKEVQTTLEKQISRMTKEIEFLQGAFESYKSTLHTETSDKWKAREEDLKLAHSNDKQQALHDLKTRLMQERNQEKVAMVRDHQKAMETLRKENKKETDSLIKKFSNAAANIERLKKTTAELDEVKEQLEQVTSDYNTTCQSLANTTRQLTDTKVRLMEFEELFQQKVAQVDDKYRLKLQELRSQNTELKRLFVQKCGELFDEKTNTDLQTTERVKTARETMESLIKSKQRAEVNLAVGGPNVEDKIRGGKTRPVSAPGTRLETEAAHITAGETMDKSKQQEFVAPEINLNPVPETEMLRAELFSPASKGKTEDAD
ncbi:hypothetical protein RRG08_038512 [Elysia crispata]|uniref:Uncharacterized protein n=1 Tax=Elysia crispata TaxID=231223 RepID=A0AAE1AHL2_9GAST|nr:hypothetical protein RRG08_038512 [Elysia crispata]